MKRFDRKRMTALALAVCLLLPCAACGGAGGQSQAKAASMWLVRTEGAVAVTDDAGADVSLTERLGLFNGYDVATRAASYGWIDLDETKLTKMDENSDVSVQKDGKSLTLTVNSGSVFFNVTEPLAADETMEIRSANMVTAIRGTCGWVEVPDAEHMNVYILEGTVECTVGAVTEPVTAGQTAALSAAEGTVAVEGFTESSVPAFVIDEVSGSEALVAAIPADNAAPDGPSEALQALLREFGYFGDPAATTMTAEQSVQLGEALRQLVTESEAEYLGGAGHVSVDAFHCYAAIFDAGDGSPAVVFMNNGDLPYSVIMGGDYPDYAGIIVLHFQDGQMVRMPNDGLDLLELNGHYAVFGGYMAPDGSASDVSREWVYDLTAGGLHGSIVSELTYDEYGPGGITVDGAPATQEQYIAWGDQWRAPDGEAAASFGIGNGGFGTAAGAQDAAALADALMFGA